MKPEEIEVIVKSIGDAMKIEEASNGPVYIMLSIIVAVAPFVFRYFRKTFTKSIEKVMEVHIGRMDDMFKIMNLHIDELSLIKTEQVLMKEKHNDLDKKVYKNKVNIEAIKEAS